MNDIKIFELNDEYICNRFRQLNFLLNEGFTPIDSFIGVNSRQCWVFKVTPELVESLNEYAKDKYKNGYASACVNYVIKQ